MMAAANGFTRAVLLLLLVIRFSRVIAGQSGATTKVVQYPDTKNCCNWISLADPLQTGRTIV